ncbi:MAG: hypothetical protein JW829_13155, partial [Pirellulales bacterium]|nr:hypothetical protein [Pirellulales bacterium]
KAKDAEANAKVEEQKAKDAEARAKDEEQKAKNNLILAESREAAAKTGRFLAQFSLAKSYISANDAGRAQEQLDNLKDAARGDLLEETSVDKTMIGWEWYRLKYLCHPPDPHFGITELSAGDSIVSMDSTPDGCRIVVATQDNRVLVYEQGKSEPMVKLTRLANQFHKINAVAISTKGQFLAIGGKSRAKMDNFLLYDISKKLDEPIHSNRPEVSTSSYEVLSIDFSSDGQYLVAGCAEGIAVWQRSSDSFVGPDCYGYSGAFRCVRFAPQNPNFEENLKDLVRVICVIRYQQDFKNENKAAIADIQLDKINDSTTNTNHHQVTHGGPNKQGNGKKDHLEQYIISKYCGDFQTAAISPLDPHLVAIGADDGRVMLWHWTKFESGQDQLTIDLYGHKRAVRDIAFCKNGKHLISASDDQSLLLWTLKQIGSKDAQGTPSQSNVSSPHHSLWKGSLSQKLPPFRGHYKSVIACHHVKCPPIHDGDLAKIPPDTEVRGEIISASSDGTIRRWDIDRYNDEQVFDPQDSKEDDHNNSKMAEQAQSVGDSSDKSSCTAANISQDGTKVITAYANGYARVWDSATGRKLFDLYVGHDREADVAIKTAVFNGKHRIVTCGSDDRICIWDGDTGRILAEQSVNGKNQEDVDIKGGILPFDISQDGRFIVTGAYRSKDDKTKQLPPRLWDGSNGQLQIDNLFPDAMLTRTVTISPSKKAILFGIQRGGMFIWDLENNQGSRFEEIHPSLSTIVGIFPTHDAKNLITVCTRCIKLWSAFRIGQNHGDLLAEILLERDAKRVFHASESNEDAFLVLTVTHKAITAESFTLELWNKQGLLEGDTGKRVALGSRQYRSAAISPDGKTVYAITPENRLVEWDWHHDENKEHPLSADINATQPQEIYFIDNHHILSTSSDLVSPDKQKRGWQGHIWRLADNTVQAEKARLSSRSAILDALFSEKGSEVITLSSDGAIRFWPLEGNMAESRVPSRQATDRSFPAVQRLILSPDRGWALSLSATDARAKLWNIKNEENSFPLELSNRGYDAQWVDNYIAILTENGVELWDLQTKRPTKLKGPSIPRRAHHMALARGSHGILLVTAHRSSVPDSSPISFWWQTQDGTWSNETRFGSSTSEITSLAISPCGRRLVSGDSEGNVEVWGIETGEKSDNETSDKKTDNEVTPLLLTLHNHRAEITSIRFSDNGRHLLTTDSSGIAVYWPASNWEEAEP